MIVYLVFETTWDHNECVGVWSAEALADDQGRRLTALNNGYQYHVEPYTVDDPEDHR